MARMRATGTSSGFQPAPISEIASPLTFDVGPPATPSFDIIEILPPAAADRLRKLRQRAADAHALVPKFEDVSEITTARLLAEQRLKRLTDPAPDGFNVAASDGRVRSQQKLVDTLTADVNRQQERQRERAAKWREAGAALQTAEEWLRHGKPHGVQLLDHDGPEPKLAKGENGPLDAIENRRRRVRELRADLHRIESSPFPSSHCKARMREQVEILAQRGEVDVGMVVEHDGKIIWPTMRVQSTVFNAQPGAVAFAEGVPDTLALLVFLLKPTLIAALDAAIDAESDDSAALTTEERQLRIAEIEGDLLAVERDESALTWLAMAERLPIEFRSDISPIALLGLRLVQAPVNRSRETSPEHMMISFAGGPL
jgi:hypothetical protein